MNKLLYVLPLVLMGCTTVPDAPSTETAVNRAVVAEGLVAARCVVGQQSPSEKMAQTAARLLFISRYGPTMTSEQQRRYDQAVSRTNDACLGAATPFVP